MDPREGSTGVTGVESSQEDSQGTDREHVDHSDDKSGSGQQDGRQHVAAEGASAGSSSRIRSMEELSNAIKLGTLSQVEQMDLGFELAGSGHFTVAKALASGEMSALQILDLRRTGLEDDRSEAIGNALASAKIPSLKWVDFSNNMIGSRGIEALGRAIQSGKLENLESLSLSLTGISDYDMATLATAFQYGDASVLPNFKRLNLEYNRFSEVGLQALAEALKSGRLDSLKWVCVDVSSNPSQEGAIALVSAFAVNNSLTAKLTFEWFRFPELERQYEQLRKRNIRYKDILAGLSGSSMVPAAFGKIYLCGDPKTGKTTLCHTLKRSFWESLWTWETSPHEETRTRGIEVSRIISEGRKGENENPLTLLVWDMAGQRDYHLVHNAFFPALSVSEGKATISQGTATIFVVVCNSSFPSAEVEKQLDYWLRYIASSYHEAIGQIQHVFVVLNNMGGDEKVQRNSRDWELVLKEKRDKFTGRLDVRTDPFIIDVRRRGEVDGFKTCLLEHSRTLLKGQIVPKICDVIQQFLPFWSEARKKFPVLGWEEFVKVKQFSEWPEQAISAATKYLDQAGVLIYVDKSFPTQWRIPDARLVVLNPNWFCKEIIGNMFLSEDMVQGTEGNHIFRKKLDATTGSISMSAFNEFFEARWGPKDCENLIAILLWLGLCYKGKEDNIFIPSLIDGNLEAGDSWQSQSKHGDGEEQWVMGFSVQHQQQEMTLAPMSLWHRYQVQLAQSTEFNNADVPDNDFVASRYSMMFTVDYMKVRIDVNAEKDSPTFDEISILVKPQFRKDELDLIQRKQCQVNLADDLVNILLDLWNEICGGVKYEQKVVWPWPVSQSRQEGYTKNRNVKVAQVKKWVQMHGMGKRVQWLVGKNSAITWDQLLSTKDKKHVIMSAKNDVNVLKQGMQEAVNLGIYPPELMEELEISTNGNEVEEAALGSDGIETMANPLTNPTPKKMQRLSTINWQLHVMDQKLDKILNNQDYLSKQVKNVERMLQEGFSEVLKEQKRMFRKLQDTDRFLKEDKDRTCPKLIYLGNRDSGLWATLKEALSPSVNVRLQFACEAMHNSYTPHQVKDQLGLIVSDLKPALKTLIPWLKVSLTVLLVSAKIATNVVAPGVGLLLPDFDQLQSGKSILDGIVMATEYSMPELDKMMTEGMGLDPTALPLNPRDVYGKSRAAITSLVGSLTAKAYEENLGLRKVCLAYNDGSLHGVVWICTACHQKFEKSNVVSDM